MEEATQADNNHIGHDDDEEEDECRVCRGPAEEGRPLFSPCKCSGSIGLTHQDCLTSWLAVTRGEGRCELCKTKFRFAPQYDESAPTNLSIPDVLLGLLRRALAKWLPFILRSAFCMSLWLLVAPLMTAYLYRIWMHRTFACVQERWKWDLIPSDMVSGAVLAAMILVSFLSLMSFADFLRVEWQQQQQLPANGIAARIRDLHPAEDDNRDLNGDNNEEHPENDIDDGLLRQEEALRMQQKLLEEERAGEERDTLVEGTNAPKINQQQSEIVEARQEIQLQDQIAQDEGDIQEADNADGEPANELNLGDEQPQRRDEVNNEDNNENRVDDQPRQFFQRNNDARVERQFDMMDPVMDDQVDMEINVALDELLGLRGPISSLIRNLLWLLVFNTVYLGFFAFIPKTIGSSVYAGIFNTTSFNELVNNLPLVNYNNSTEGLVPSFRNTVTLINEESDRLSTAFRLPDFATINLGYFSMAFIVILVRFAWQLSIRLRAILRPHESSTSDDNSTRFGMRQNNDRENNGVDGNLRDRQRAEDVNDARLQMHVFDDQDIHPLVGDGFDHAPFSVSEGITLILDATVAVVKVGVLLFLKMFLLPVLLGIWLDGSTMGLFGFTMKDRVLYAGKDLFSFILLHWVAGITFMLLVTVSVLQLREVAHPDLLAHLIRPQEPQPDLLGNLMHDSVLTQTKRMMLSLAIYTALLNLHVSIPVKLLLASGVTNYLPFLEVRFWHLVMPQLQIPLELLVFHLSMLALLEKYKNSIGEMQHHWLKFMCHCMGLTEYLLPQGVENFIFFGVMPVFNSKGEVEESWYDMAEGSGKDPEEVILSKISKLSSIAQPTYDLGEVKDSGERVLTESQTFIRLPPRRANLLKPEDSKQKAEKKLSALLPTKLGRFRLKRKETASCDETAVIEVWQEVPGKPIARPPEGWDDLGAGGADVQGRWAWGKEKRSTIEGGVAKRARFFDAGQKSRLLSFILVAKVFILLLSSWLVTTISLCVIVALPLAIGRFVYFILRVEERFIHYPLGFAVGSCIVFPTAAILATWIMSPTNNDVTLWRRFKEWFSAFNFPPARKLFVVLASAFLWVCVCPLALGSLYELNLVKTSKCFNGEEPLITSIFDVGLCWIVGFVLLNAWACLCSLSVFTKDFWVNIGNGMLDAPPNEDGVAGNAQAENGNERGGPPQNDAVDRPLLWQGKNGRISKFFAISKMLLVRWDWEAVDHVPLLRDCALPVTRQLLLPLIVPSICHGVWIAASSLLGLQEVSAYYHVVVYRTVSFATLLVQLSLAFDDQIRNWFSAAHKTARDDRYLIGEILLNYDPNNNE